MAALFVFTLLWFGFWAQYGVDPHHDGIMLKAAADVAAGQTLYGQTYSHYGILTVFFQAAALCLFGTKLLVIKYLGVVFYALSAVLIYWISKRFLDVKYLWIPLALYYLYAPLYFWEFQPWCSVFSLFFSLAAFYAVLWCVDKPQSGFAFFVAGILSILPFWFRQTCIVFELAVPALLIIWLFGRRFPIKTLAKQFFLFLLGSIAVSLPIVLWIAGNHVTQQYIEQTFIGTLQFANSAAERNLSDGQSSNSFVTIIKFFLFGGVGGFYFVMIWNTVIGFLCSAYAFFTKKCDDCQTSSALLLFVFAGLSIHQFFPCPCPWHFYWGGIIGYIALAYSIQTLIKTHRSIKLIKVAAIVLAIGLFLLPFASVTKKYYNLAHDPMSEFYFPVNRIQNAQTIQQAGVLKGMKVHKTLAAQWELFFEALDSIPEENRNDPVINFTREGLYPLFFNNQNNFNGRFIHFGCWADDKYQEQIQNNNSIVLFYYNNDIFDLLRQNSYTVIGPCNLPPTNVALKDFNGNSLYIAYRKAN
ncbi:MAG: hypothetical protein IKS45_01895 [Thermoguttaceae bacterium]|nr:hypothetical protein [Thermoguttaceae bacterium]